jgi:phosphoribosyl 1,2-cyclic phosphodiesterase
MSRQFGIDDENPSNIRNILGDLRCIFVSHSHADHMIGVSRLLSKRRKVMHLSITGHSLSSVSRIIRNFKLLEPSAKPLYLLCNNFIYRSLRDYAQLEDLGLSSEQVVHIDTRDHALRSQNSAIANDLGENKGYAFSATGLSSLFSLIWAGLWHSKRL